MGSKPKGRIQLCGELAVQLEGDALTDGLMQRQIRLLFGYLVVNRSRKVSRDEAIGAVWSDDIPEAVDSSLSALLSKLRGALARRYLEGRSDLRLVLPPNTWIDVEAAIDAVHRAESFASLERWTDAWVPAQVACSISRRVFMSGLDGAPWVDQWRRRLEDIHVRALECDARAALGLGGVELPVAEASARLATELAPYRESGYEVLMAALERQGNFAEALRVFERVRRLLRIELGVKFESRCRKTPETS